MLLVNFLIVVFLILLNGFFAMSELAVVSSRRGKLQQMANNGSQGAARALKLVDDPTSFLSTVQVGITLVGIFAGAFGASAFSGPLADVLVTMPVIGPYSQGAAFAIVVVVITYLSLILGELVPKRFALNHSEGIASFVAPFMLLLARIGAPVVWFLRISTETVSRLVGISTSSENSVTEEEVKAMIAEGTQSGVFEPKERELIEGVLRIADRTARSVMVPRPDVYWISIDDEQTSILDEIHASGHSRFPVSGEEVDDIIGVVQAKDLLEQIRLTGAIDIKTALREPLYVNETMPVLKLLDRFQNASTHMAIVLDEYGTFEGVVTPTDILASIAGALPEGTDEEHGVTQRADGSYLVDAGMTADNVERLIPGLVFPRERDYETFAGFILDCFGHIPDVGETMDYSDWRFEVVDLDGRRIDKVLATFIGTRNAESETAE
ncbi:HlyC/CorC family transporter [Aureimonas fodinaquatilis]|uniref:HlyC/CorC family transporter n=1 Tax=Aureimonas fodinaquatilis TaxID=2565783 RepID=A0A5B0DZK1_9HYPH|nr:hemolysin family protein [Aureimonas fodinaquatilis]KAA0971866.1 HlyC/CorC family transporter [Aureimonas fodinaquatilis]